jgi:hypothetical protein
MCTVVVRVPAEPGGGIHLLAVRDEDPEREWNPPGAWWPDTRPGVVGVRDVRAGGAWLATDPTARRLAVILNRAEVPGATASRGDVVLDAVAGRPPAERPATNGFNLLVVEAGAARLHAWDGGELRSRALEPGVHMIAHDDLDDQATPRIAQWLPEFAAAPAGEAEEAGWLAVLQRSSALEPTDDRAIVRDNRPYGYPTLSLLVCTATVSPDGVALAWRALDTPGHWNALDLERWG